MNQQIIHSETKQNWHIRRFLTKQNQEVDANYFLTINLPWTSNRHELKATLARLLDKCDRSRHGCRDASKLPSAERTQFWARAEKVKVQSHLHIYIKIESISHKEIVLENLKELKIKRRVENYDLKRIYDDSSQFRDYANKEVIDEAVHNVICMKDLYY